MSAVRERRTAPTNGSARLALVLCVASALSIAVDAATYSYVGNCDDISVRWNIAGRAGGMRGASRRAGGMRGALTIVVAVLAVLAEPVSGATESLNGLTVTSRIAGSGNNRETDVVDGNSAAESDTFYAGEVKGNKYEAQLNPWVQIDLGGTKTIGSIDIYGDRSSTFCNIAFIDPNPVRADKTPYACAGAGPVNPDTDRNPVDTPGTTGIIAVGDTACTSGSECILGVDPLDNTKTVGVVATVCAHLKKPTDVGFDGGGLNTEGKFTVDW